MMNGRLVAWCVVVCCLAAALGNAADARLSALLDEAERIQKSDKAKSRQLLDQVERDPAAQTDPLLVARVQLLECRWADDPKTAHRALAIGLPAAERAGSVVLRAKLMSCRASALLAEGKEGASEQESRSVLALARQARDTQLEAEALLNIGYIQYTRGAMADALTNLQTAYRLSGQRGDRKGELDALANMANVYADTHVAQYDRAIEYYRQLVVEYEKHGQATDVADTFFNIGSTFERKGDFAAAEHHYRRALAMFQQLGSAKDVAYTDRSLASALMKQGRAREALPLLDASLKFYQEAEDEGNLAFTRQHRGIALRRLGRPAEALRELDASRRHYEKEKNVRFLEKDAEEMALDYEQLGDWKNAYAASRRHRELQQALAETRRDEISSRLRIEFDAQKKENENRALAREGALRATALREAERNQKLQIAVIALTTFLAIALALLFWRQVANTRRMRTMALTDELTGLPNRRHILDAVDRAFEVAKREGHRAAIIVLDIDRFKEINDRHGHAAGDTVLQSVARACRTELRAVDQVGRVGGEEFLVVLQSATGPQAREIAERLRAAVERLDFPAIDPSIHVTISLGVWVANRHDSRAAIAAADSLLYRAKASGRNRVEMEVAGG